jgi:hypothetical protein
VAGLFSARGYNIESLTVAATEDQTLSRMTIVTAIFMSPSDLLMPVFNHKQARAGAPLAFRSSNSQVI